MKIPWQSPQPLRRFDTGGEGADQLQLALGQDGLFGVEADPNTGFAALNRFNNRELSTAGILNADQIAGMERRGCQGISPRG